MAKAEDPLAADTASTH